VRTIGRASFRLVASRGVVAPTAIVTVGNQARGNAALYISGIWDDTCATVHGSRKFSRFTHWCRSCARGWSPVCWGPDAASTASVSRGKRGAVVAPRPGWRSAAAGSPGLRANSRAGTRRAGITGASANSCLPGPGSARESAPAPRRRLISLLKQFQMSGDWAHFMRRHESCRGSGKRNGKIKSNCKRAKQYGCYKWWGLNLMAHKK